MTDTGWMVEVYLTTYEIKDVRRVFDIPDEIADKRLAECLAQDLVDRFFTSAYWGEKDIEQIVDGILSEGE